MIKLNSIKLNDGSHGLPKNPRFIKDDFRERLAGVGLEQKLCRQTDNVNDVIKVRLKLT